jgi:hypothetical protein
LVPVAEIFQEKMLDNDVSIMLIIKVKVVDGTAMIGTRHTFASYFAFAVDTTMKVLLREGVARGQLELVRLTGQRIRRLERRFNALLARWRAGTLPAVGHDEVTPPLNPVPQGEGDSNDHGSGTQRAPNPFPRGGGGSAGCWRR